MCVCVITVCILRLRYSGYLVEDQERNNGFDKPYFMSKELQKLMGVHNRVKETTDGGDVRMEDLK